ncbi:MAG: hypothetical protein ACMXYE_02975, partial [Candidatus Woesearchaeota archaeon]
MNFKELSEQIKKYPDAETWNKGAIETALKQGNITESERHTLVGMVEGKEVKIKFLEEEHEFPVKKYPDQANFLILHNDKWNDLQIFETDNNINNLFLILAEVDLLNDTCWPDLIKLLKELEQIEEYKEYSYTIKGLFEHDLYILYNSKILTRDYWHKLSKTLIKFISCYGKEYYDKKVLYYIQSYGKLKKEYWEGWVELAYLFKTEFHMINYGLSTLFTKLVTEENWSETYNKIIYITNIFQEKETWHSIPMDTFSTYGLDCFDLLIQPIAESQTIASAYCFNEIKRMSSNALKKKEDISVLLKIIKYKQRRAYDTLKNLINPIINESILELPLAKEKECLFAFLQESPVMLPELFKQFKELYYNNPNRNEHTEQLFKHAKALMKDIRNGSLSQDYDLHLVTGVLYSVFSPELSVDRQMLVRALENRQDRDSDIPKEVGKLKEINVKISKGSYVQTDEINTDAWNIIVNAVNFV